MAEQEKLIVGGEVEDTQKGKFLTFQLDKEVFGIEIKYVTEIIDVQPITIVPQVPVYVKGIINLRGKIIPVIDIRLRFHKEPMEYNERTCIVVIDIKEITIGLIVDCVVEVIKIGDDNIVPPPTYKAGFQNPYIKGIGKVGNEVDLILDCERLISKDEASVLRGLD